MRLRSHFASQRFSGRIPTGAVGSNGAVRAVWRNTILAESNETILVEGNHYFPPESVRCERLQKTRMRSLCPWKGIASYSTVVDEGDRNRNAAWTYPRPFPWVRKIRAHVAFWNGVEVRP